MVHSFLQNSRNDKCGSLKKNFQTQCALNDDQHPKKVMGVSDTFQSHAWDQAHTEAQKKKCKQKEESKQNESNEQDKATGTSLAQQHKNMASHCCGEKGHCVSDCPMRDKMSQENWAIEKGIWMVQNLNNETTIKANKMPSSNGNNNDSSEQ